MALNTHFCLLVFCTACSEPVAIYSYIHFYLGTNVQIHTNVFKQQLTTNSAHMYTSLHFCRFFADRKVHGKEDSLCLYIFDGVILLITWTRVNV